MTAGESVITRTYLLAATSPRGSVFLTSFGDPADVYQVVKALCGVRLGTFRRQVKALGVDEELVLPLPYRLPPDGRGFTYVRALEIKRVHDVETVQWDDDQEEGRP